MKIYSKIKIAALHSTLMIASLPFNSTAAVVINSTDYGDNYHPTESQNLPEAKIDITNGSSFITDLYFSIGDREPTKLDYDTIDISGEKSKWIAHSDLDLGNSSPGNASQVIVTIKNGGSLLTDGEINLGKGVNDTSTMIVTGKNSSLNMSNTKNQDLNVGNEGNGTLSISNEAVVNASNIDVGKFVGSNGKIIIEGENTQLNVNRDLYIGDFGTGVVTLKENSTLNVEAGTGTIYIANRYNSSGTLNIGTGNKAGKVTASEINMGLGDALLKFNLSDPDYQFNTTIKGNGRILKQGVGNVTLNGNNSSFTGQTTVEEGMLNVNAVDVNDRLGGDVYIKEKGALQGNGYVFLGNINNNGKLIFKQDNNGIYSGRLSGTGLNVITGDKTLVISGDNTPFKGQTVVKSGLLQVGDNQGNGSLGGDFVVDPNAKLQGTAASLLGDILNNGTVTFVQNDDGTYKYFLSGTGTISVSGSKTLTLTGNSTDFFGKTIVDNGSLSLREGDTIGHLGGNITISSTGKVLASASSFSGDIENNGNLTLSDKLEEQYSGKLSGNGTIIKESEGKIYLSGDNSKFSGVLEIKEGKVYLGTPISPGNLGGTISVKSFATLMGNGNVSKDLFIFNDATHEVNLVKDQKLAQIIGGEYVNYGTLKLHGNDSGLTSLTLQKKADITGSHLDVSLSPKSNFLSKLYNAPQIIILNNSDKLITGEFSQVTTNLAFMKGDVIYNAGDGNDVSLQLTRNDVKFSDVAATSNQRSTTAALDKLNHLNIAWRGVALSDKNAIQSNFDQLSGEFYPSLNTAIVKNAGQIKDIVSEHLQNFHSNTSGVSSVSKYASDDYPESVTVWAKNIYSWNKFTEQNNFHSLSSNNKGIIVGADMPKENGRLGAFFSYVNADVNSNSVKSNADINSYYWGAYGIREFNNFSLLVGLNAGWHDINSERSIDLPDYKDKLVGSFKDKSLQIYTELSKEFVLDTISITPYSGLSYMSLQGNSIKESDGDGALTVSNSGIDTYSGSLGARVSKSTKIFDTPALMFGNINLNHYFGDTSSSVNSNFKDGEKFHINGVPLDKNELKYAIGSNFGLTKNSEVGVSYMGSTASGSHTNSAWVNYTYSF